MAATSSPKKVVRYPTSDGKPMAETDAHRNLMVALILTLQHYFRDQRDVYVSGNLLVYYEPGNRRKHVSPDVFMVRGVDNHLRDYYLTWEEKSGPQVVIELTSSSTRREDTHRKFHLYQDVLRVKEYFHFDPFGDYLSPRMQGHRLRRGEYRPLRPIDGRLPSQVLGLQLEQAGDELRLFDPRGGARLPTQEERLALQESQLARQEQRLARQDEQFAHQNEQRARQDQEIERLRRELDALKNRRGKEL